MLFNKKASLEISIQAIVIVVLAMTLLGLGLGFIKGMFKNITGTTEQVSEQVKQKILDDLVQGDKKVSFPTTEVIIDRGSATVLTVGIRNKDNQELRYKMLFTPVNGPVSGAELTDFTKYFQYDSTKEYTLGASESDIRNIRLSVPSGATSGSYFLTFRVTRNPHGANDIYTEKDFFVVVRG